MSEAVVWTVVAVAVFVANVVAHEVAHACALRRLGGELAAAGVGLPIRPMLRLRPRGRRSFLVTVSPWLIIAYVRPTVASRAVIERSGYLERAWYHGAGAVANALLGLVFLAAHRVLDGHGVGAVICLGAAVLVWVLRVYVAAFVVPVAGVVALGVIGFALWTSFGEPLGVVATAQTLVVNDGEQAARLAVVISCGLALLNAVPLVPFDGGQVVGAAMSRLAGERAAAVFRGVTSWIALVFVGYLVLSDLWLLVG